MRPACAALAMALAAACCCCAMVRAGRAPALHPLEAVQPGMTAEQVEDALGSPCTVDAFGGRTRREVWRYDDGIVILDRGRVTYRFQTSAPKP